MIDRHRNIALRFAICCALIFPAIGKTASGRETLHLTLGEALQRAMVYNEQFLIAEEEQTRAKAQIAQARAEILPNVQAFGDYTRTFAIPPVYIVTPEGVQTFKFEYEHSVLWGVSATQSLFKGGRVFAAWSAARLYGRYVEQLRRQALLDLQSGVAVAFFDAILAAQRTDVARQTLALTEETQAIVQQQFEQGQTSEYDLLRARVQVANVKPQVTQAANRYELTLTNLRHLLGVEAGVPLRLVPGYPDSANWEAEPLEELVLRARTGRPELTQAELQVRLREKAVTVAKAEHYPSLELTGGYTVSASRSTFGLDHWLRGNAWRAMLSLSIPIFEGMRISSGVRQAKVDLSQARLRDRATAKAVALDVEQAHNNFGEARERLASQAETVGQAEKGYQIAQLRYREGVGTQLEVTDALVSLASARLNENLALRDYLVARVQLRRAVGEPVLDGLARRTD